MQVVNYDDRFVGTGVVPFTEPQNTGKKEVYLKLKNYRFCEAYKEPKEGFLEHVSTDKQGNTHIRYIRYIDGAICGIVVALIYERQPYKTWKMHIETQNEVFILSFSDKDSFCERLTQCLPNIDFGLPITFSAWEGKKKKTVNGIDTMVAAQAVNFQQGGINAPAYFTKATPNGMPKMIKSEVSGEWNSFEKDEFSMKLRLDLSTAIANNNLEYATRLFEREQRKAGVVTPPPPTQNALQTNLPQKTDIISLDNPEFLHETKARLISRIASLKKEGYTRFDYEHDGKAYAFAVKDAEAEFHQKRICGELPF